MRWHIAGAGGFGREALDALRAISPDGASAAVFVDEYCPRTRVAGLPVLRPEEVTRGRFVVAIADPVVRRRLAALMTDRGLASASIVDPRALVSPGATLGPGCVVLGHAFISTGTVLGSHVHVNYNATVGHDAVLHDYVTVLPGANIAGAVTIEIGSTIGSNAAVLQGLRVGSFTVVGAGAVVTRDACQDEVLVGVPARPLRRGQDLVANSEN